MVLDTGADAFEDAVDPQKSARGRITKVSANKATKAKPQPSDSMRSKDIGSNTNCPREPTDMEVPSASERLSAGINRLIAPNTTGNVVPDKPMPINMPALKIRAVEDERVAIRARPVA